MSEFRSLLYRLASFLGWVLAIKNGRLPQRIYNSVLMRFFSNFFK